ncbi:regulator of protease activity HflC (stomatin/prohibitin superfamily) [Streptomyces sp. 1114.5]|uniref:SPFH domain-containing protein n=1 Tax=Streptomyces sp. 1114.5 TaxID=1938830 RepID=UPI000EB08BAA|nr:SPFH domain-containing protein [Streptomyces sp. 1114.5]RKT16912.1 regulator of protease activity HflC (stomatin/prohibitin superfamily) [Streptomyces sp. 1114.5]
MDVTRDSSQRPENLSKAFPPAVPERFASGAGPLAGASAIRAVKAAPADSGPATTSLAVLPGPSSVGPVDLRDPLEAAAPETVELLDPVRTGASTAATSRRPPRADQALREHAATTLPGWLALLVLLLGLAGALFVLLRTGVVPHWEVLPDLRGAGARASGRAEVDARAIAGVSASGLLVVLALAGLLANAGGETRVLSRWGRYRGTVRRTGLVWVNPLLRRRRVDVRLRHWRSEPVKVVDRTGTPIVVRLLVVWRVKDTARALLAIEDHEGYLREQVQAVLTRTASTLPCDSNAAPGPALRDGQWFADEMTRALAAEAAPAGLEVYSVQPLALDYAPEVAESMRRRRLADLDAGLRTVLVDDAVEAAALAVRRLERATAHELDEAARSALMEQLLVAFVAPAGLAASVPPPAARAGRKEGRPA